LVAVDTVITVKEFFFGLAYFIHVPPNGLVLKLEAFSAEPPARPPLRDFDRNIPLKGLNGFANIIFGHRSLP
jgi:hypothetical protein